jgi:hypothetical protein
VSFFASVLLGEVLSELVRLALDQKTNDQAKQSEDGAENLDDQNFDKPVHHVSKQMALQSS